MAPKRQAWAVTKWYSSGTSNSFLVDSSKVNDIVTMCGIAGWLDYRNCIKAPQTLCAMTNSLRHRGPDGEGYYESGSIHLGHRRLSVIDIQGSSQPISNEDKSIWLVFNGEIFNFCELRQRLMKYGHRFHTEGDSETIVHAYEQYGDAFVNHLQGQFAIALWDENHQKLFLARDRMGQIPLHFHLTKSGVIFGSEIKSLLEHPEVPNEIDIHSLDAYLAYKYVPDPQTIYQNIFKLPAAHRLIITQKETKLERYWSPPEEHEPEISKVDVLNRLDALLSDAVRCRMVSDVPLGAFLSGGIDSSLVVAYMAANSARPIQTFTIGFDDATYDERIYAKQVSERFNTVHHEFIVTMDAAKVVPELVAAFDEPFADSSALPVYYLSKLTRQHVTVALNGDGGDESFGGYSRYFSTEKFERYRRLPTMLRSVVGMGARLAANGGLEKNVLVRRLNRWNDLEDKSLGEIYQRSVQMPSSLRESLYRPESLSQLTRGPDQVSKAVDGVRGHDTLNRIMGGDRLTYLPGDLLVKVDRMCMHHHLEGRSPFLDHRVVEFAAGLSSSMKCPKQDAKYLLKRLLEKSFPREFTYRKKMGFGVPLASWFRNSKQLKELVFDQSANCPHIDPKSVAKLYREHSVGSHDHSSALWTIVMLESWYASR